MPNLTISITEELKKEMEKVRETNWSEVIRGLLAEKVKRALLLKKLDKLLENSELTDEDISSMTAKSRKGRFDKLKAEGKI